MEEKILDRVVAGTHRVQSSLSPS